MIFININTLTKLLNSMNETFPTLLDKYTIMNNPLIPNDEALICYMGDNVCDKPIFTWQDVNEKGFDRGDVHIGYVIDKLSIL